VAGSNYDQEGSTFFATELGMERADLSGYDTHYSFDRPMSRSGAKSQSSSSSLPAVGSKHSVFQDATHQEMSDEDRARTASPPNEAFQNVSLENFGKNSEFVKERVADGGENEYEEEDAYDNDFEG
jgi:hypothetical protein